MLARRVEGRLCSLKSPLLPQSVIMANRDLVITHMNPACRVTLEKLEHLLPVRVDDFVGQNIDIFHKEPVPPGTHPRPDEGRQSSFEDPFRART